MKTERMNENNPLPPAPVGIIVEIGVRSVAA